MKAPALLIGAAGFYNRVPLLKEGARVTVLQGSIAGSIIGRVPLEGL